MAANIGPSVIVVGGGTVGLSTAWYLTQSPRQYSTITVLDPFPPPAFPSAGYDINKLIRTEYDEPIQARLAQEAVDIWASNPIFKPYWHNTGGIRGTFQPPPYKEWQLLMHNTLNYTNASQLEIFGADATKPYAERWPDFFGGNPPPPGLVSAWNGVAGWADAGAAQGALAKHLEQDSRVRFLSGPPGAITGLLRENGKVTGVETTGNIRHSADIVVIAMGAWTADIIDLEKQAAPGFSFVTKIKLDETEYEKFKGMPPVNIEGPGNLVSQAAGYFFPPDENRLVKIVAKVKGHYRYTYFDAEGNMVTVPPAQGHDPRGKLTLQDAVDYRQFIKTWLPQIGEKPFTESNACWDLVTFDNYWILGPHPSSPESLFIATGGNGHTFKNLPNVGKYVVQSIEGILDPELAEAFRWRPEKAPGIVPGVNDFAKVETFVNDGENPPNE